MNTVELKFKEKNQRVKWEDLPVMLLASKGEINTSVEWLRRMFKCIEIRWNHSDSPQGHYVNGNISRY